MIAAIPHLDSTLPSDWLAQLHTRCLRDFDGDVLWRELADAYSAPPRGYHTLWHVAFMFAQYDRVAARLAYPVAVRAAIWFHDFVYETDAGAYSRNESRSADAMRRRCMDLLPAPEVELAAALILATKTHEPGPAFFPGDPAAYADCEHFLDIDLAIFACAPAQVRAFDDAVRDEFRQYADGEFAAGRLRVPRALLARPRIYFSAAFEPCEPTARANLRRLIERWEKRAGERDGHARSNHTRP
ncbi:HD domain-containing protein [Aromatoleum aromaticum]|uniref:N-methyl-D-aspartate receptor NMDAR2C subunit n=1 Tax=Aromatoleum aromaticum (strain DSM 19018 / LMG 30748 / EbN1) TaxID=76114 RepID=Q5P7Y9_AROAE|nr:hypothetical protein [Aromatoleum aromaticum]NMG55466.1 hypothetical protein [Aromatoleum aromaticum]CAI06572.1 conserved hypothetical protein [Aromatoleum aromaticum EbN1]